MHTESFPIEPPPAPGRQAPEPGGGAYRFGQYTLYPARKLLASGERAVVLGGRAFDLLVALVMRAGEVVSHQDLLAAVWPHAVVEENGLRVHMSALRKALGESPADQFIATVLGQGYRFVKPVSPGPGPRAPAPAVAWRFSPAPPAAPAWATGRIAASHGRHTAARTESTAWHAGRALANPEFPVDPRIYVFGAFSLRRQGRQLRLGSAPMHVGGRALELLFVLVERAGEVVSRAELERLIWPDSVVEDSCLRVHIGALRKALGENTGRTRYIANVPGRGYSFVAPVAVLSRTAPQAHGGRPAALALLAKHCRMHYIDSRPSADGGIDQERTHG